LIDEWNFHKVQVLEVGDEAFGGASKLAQVGLATGANEATLPTADNPHIIHGLQQGVHYMAETSGPIQTTLFECLRA
jgi:hypothetical protein